MFMILVVLIPFCNIFNYLIFLCVLFGQHLHTNIIPSLFLLTVRVVSWNLQDWHEIGRIDSDGQRLYSCRSNFYCRDWPDYEAHLL